MSRGFDWMVAAAGAAATPASGGGIGDSILPGLLIAAGMLLATTLVMRLTWRKARQRKVAAATGPSEPKERLQAVRERAVSGREPLESLMADAEALTRRCASVLDMKAARLEALIADADERLAQLERAGRVGASREDVDLPGDAAGRETGHGAVPSGRRRPDPSALGRARLAQLAAERPESERVVDAAAREPERVPAEKTGHAGHGLTDATRAVIWRLADEGVAAVDIAQRTGQPVGSVELVLNLRKSG